jgi:hypothetical protein
MIIPVTMTSILSGKKHTRNYAMTKAQIDAYTDPNRKQMIQDIFPELEDADREFLMTGITEAEWAAAFPPEEEDNG